MRVTNSFNATEFRKNRVRISSKADVIPDMRKLWHQPKRANEHLIRARGARAFRGGGGLASGSMMGSVCLTTTSFVNGPTRKSPQHDKPHDSCMKQTGAQSAGDPHAGCDVAGAGNRFTVWLLRHSLRKRGETARPDLRNTVPLGTSRDDHKSRDSSCKADIPVLIIPSDIRAVLK